MTLSDLCGCQFFDSSKFIFRHKKVCQQTPTQTWCVGIERVLNGIRVSTYSETRIHRNFFLVRWLIQTHTCSAWGLQWIFRTVYAVVLIVIYRHGSNVGDFFFVLHTLRLTSVINGIEVMTLTFVNSDHLSRAHSNGAARFVIIISFVFSESVAC